MTWNTLEIQTALKAMPFSSIGKSDEVSLALFDPVLTIGVGSDGDSNIILLLPGQRNSIGFSTVGADFLPMTSALWVEKNQLIDDVAMLRCRLKLSEDDLVAALSAIFAGLIDLQIRFDECGEAIWGIKELFESGFKREIDRDALNGLAGELVVIFSSSQPDFLVSTWHSKTDSTFDFSLNNKRLEVKTTAGVEREHHFSENQVNSSHNVEIFISSVILKLVEVGVSFESFCKIIADELSVENSKKFFSIVSETIGVLPELVTDWNVDLDSTLSSLQIFESKEIPTPIKIEGVISVKWKASLAQALACQYSVDDILNSQ